MYVSMYQCVCSYGKGKGCRRNRTGKVVGEVEKADPVLESALDHLSGGVHAP
jgi:hypothetical protein